MTSRTIVVGDIHGCYDELMELLAKVNFGANDRVVAVGDLVTKGPKNREVLELFMTDARFSSVIGNHDLALRRKWNGEKLKLKASQKTTHKELKERKRTYAVSEQACRSRSISTRIWSCMRVASECGTLLPDD
jgi:predicted phosphodiesterase